MSSEAKQVRRWTPRFSLRALMLGTLLIACLIGWWDIQTRLAIRQQSAVQHIRSLSGHATYQYKLDDWNAKPPLPPVLLRRFTGNVVMDDVVKMSLHSTFAGDTDLEVLSNLPRLKDVRLNVRHLTDQGVAPIASLRQLQRLDLWCEQISDDALPHLSQLHQLEKLDLSFTQVTDEGLIHLRGLRNLKELKVRQTRVTERGAAALQESLPACVMLGVGTD